MQAQNSFYTRRLSKDERAETRVIENALALPVCDGSFALLDHWRRARQSGGLHLGRDIPSPALAKTLANLMICEPLGTSDVRLHHVGTEIEIQNGLALTGTLLSDQLPPEDFARWLEHQRRVMSENVPVMLDRRRTLHGAVIAHDEVLMVPAVAKDGVSIWVVAAVSFHPVTTDQIHVNAHGATALQPNAKDAAR